MGKRTSLKGILGPSDFSIRKYLKQELKKYDDEGFQIKCNHCDRTVDHINNNNNKRFSIDDDGYLTEILSDGTCVPCHRIQLINELLEYYQV